jgi:hypothetical protein
MRSDGAARGKHDLLGGINTQGYCLVMGCDMNDIQASNPEPQTTAPAANKPVRARGAGAMGAAALGALALGATAIGALAIGRFAVGALAVKRGRVRSLIVDDLEVRRLHIHEFVIDGHRSVQDDPLKPWLQLLRTLRKSDR